MVLITTLSQAATMVFVLFSSTADSQAITIQQVKDALNDMATKAKAINTTAQTINAQTSCFNFGFTGGGPLEVSSAGYCPH